MGSYAALVRAINVGGRNRVAMADLRAMFDDLGFGSAKTFLQSGNVVFTSGSRSAKAIEGTLEDGCAAQLGLETDFMVRSARQWRDVVAKNPFQDEATRTPDRLAVLFLKKPATATGIATLEDAIKGSEYVAGAGGHVYIVYPDGIGRSRLTPTIMERALGSSGTARNWNTVLKLEAALAS